ncbi:MAG TPA: CDP-glucose 4,6-dehydratase [Bacillota bacterium]|nr:CDP-glucose 4,6-dehydratase [Bacillota bacterium]
MNEHFLDLFKGKRVLVTGDTGFKGSWLALWLHRLGAEVVGFALPPAGEQDHYNILGLDKLIRHVDGDIRDQGTVQKVFDEFKPEVLFHLAAQSLVRYSYDEPKATFDTNVAGSVNILEAVRTSESLRSVIYVTSDKCYRNKEWIWGYRENDELGGHDPYSASKAAAEIVFSSYLDSFLRNKQDLGIASVRAGNVIGGGDWATDRIIPDCVRSLQASQPIILRNPDATRPWQHVLEPLSGYMLLAARLFEQPGEYSGSWNFGPEGQAIRSVRDLAGKFVECWGEGSLQICRPAGAPHEAGLLHLNCDKARQLLGWHSRWDFERTVCETAEWYREIGAGTPALEVSGGQIQDYMEAIYD